MKSSWEKEAHFREAPLRSHSTFQINGAAWWTDSDYAERASTLLTDLAYQRPPRTVAMPRAFRASAI
jgi:hypothetical protein